MEARSPNALFPEVSPALSATPQKRCSSTRIGNSKSSQQGKKNVVSGEHAAFDMPQCCPSHFNIAVLAACFGQCSHAAKNHGIKTNFWTDHIACISCSCNSSSQRHEPEIKKQRSQRTCAPQCKQSHSTPAMVFRTRSSKKIITVFVVCFHGRDVEQG